MNKAQLLDDSLFLIWNNRNAPERLVNMAKVYHPDIEFYEGDGGEAIIGFTKIDDLISKLQADWAADFEFQVKKPARANHEVQVAMWTLGSPDSEPIAAGMDIAHVEDGKIRKLYLFLE